MFEKQKKHKNPTNNINININLKVESKSNHLIGRKISNNKQIGHSNKDIARSNISTETLHKKKMSFKENHCKSKKSVEQFVNEHTISYENNDSQEQLVCTKVSEKPAMARNDFLKQGLQKDKKRLKSKSLQNLKVKYYERSLEKSRQSHSKSRSKSIRKKKVQSPKSFIRSGKQVKSNEKNVTYSKSKSKSKSRSKSKSKSLTKSISKSPLPISKKKSSQIFKIQQSMTSRDKQREISKSKRTDKSREKNKIAAKKHSYDLPKDKQKTTILNINKKYSAPTKKGLGKKISSDDKGKLNKKAQVPKATANNPQQQQKQRKQQASKKKKTNNKYIYHQSYLNKLVTKVQSHLKGFLARKKIQRELNQESNRILNFRTNQNWDLQSSNSIILLDNFSQNSNTSSHKILDNKCQPSNAGQQNGAFNPVILQQLQKLKKKIQEQEDRFKLLQKQNNQLKANLSKISKEPNETIILLNSKQQSQELLQKKMKTESESYSPSAFSITRNRSPIDKLPVAIKTEESNHDLDYIDMRKKMEMYQSPKNGDMPFKFNKTVIKKLFLKEEQKLNQKYFKKNKQYQHMLRQEMTSPKSLSIKKEQLQKKIDQEKQDALNKYKEAEKALLLIAELQQDNSHSISYRENQYIRKENLNSNSNVSSKNGSPQRKGLNLHINVDQIDSDAEKYHPIISNHFYRQNQYQLQKQQEDLSLLYKNAMNEAIQNKKCEGYLRQDSEIHYEQKTYVRQNNSPEIQDQRPQQGSCLIERQQQSKIQSTAKGFQTNLRYIREFYIRFCQFFRQIPLYVDEIIENLADQITYDVELFLKSYRASAEINGKIELIFPYFKQLSTYNLAIPVHILNSFYEEQTNPESPLFNKACFQLQQSSRDQHQMEGYSFYELKQYHDLALIDAFNQALNYERPGGVNASNIDYLIQDYHTVFRNRVRSKFGISLNEAVKQQHFDHILGNSIGRVINEWAVNLCGFLNDSNDPEEQLQGQKLEEVRYVRLSLMLEKALAQEEGKNIDTNSFQLFVKYDLESKIFDMLLEECLESLGELNQKRRLAL